jgi:hypothetical protein
MVQFIETAASAAVWFRLMGVAPAAPLTGALATSPSFWAETVPLAKSLTVRGVVVVPVVAVAVGVAVADAVALADAVGEPLP